MKKEHPIDPSVGETTDETAGGEETLTKLTEQDAHDIAAVIQSAGEDPETIQLVARLKDEHSELLEELQLSGEDILNQMKITLDEMKMVEYLFKDSERALVEMEKEGLIPPEHLKKYKKDPSLLEGDTKHALYFRFISLAVAGGYL